MNFHAWTWKKLASFLALGFFLALSMPALALPELFPESNVERFHTFGLFQDGEAMFMRTNREETWLNIAGDIPLLGFHDASESQIVFSPSVLSNVIKNRLTQTIDYRFMVSYNFSPLPDFLMRFGYVHASGHANDDTIDQSLSPLNFDEDNFIFRVIYTGVQNFRFGLSVMPVLNADPRRMFFSGNQFAEYFPFGQRADHGPNYFIAVGAEEYGVTQEHLSLNFQTGFYFGNHLLPTHTTTQRLVFGGYTGPHPALKQFAYRQLEQSFLYCGLIVDI